jgi:hypothetical protein
LLFGDVFVFNDEKIVDDQGSEIELPRGHLVVVVRPRGSELPDIGPVGPWMFACRDVHGRARGLTLPPLLNVKLVSRIDE